MRAVETLRAYLLDLLPDPERAGREEARVYARLLRDYPERGGKMLRGRLLLAVAEGFGAGREAAMGAAAALELFQNWVLIHDDIEDESEERRGRPALHRLYGVPLALNAGDALHAMMWRVLVAAGYGPEVLLEFACLVERTAYGQHLDLYWIERNVLDLTEDDYFEMVRAKTAYYTAVAPLRLGALVAGREPPAVFETAGERLGVAFQIVDDVLNLEADPAAYGKEIAGDLYEGKRTLIVLDFLRRAPREEAERARRILLKPRAEKDPAEVAWLHRRLLESGAAARARARAEAMAEEALSELAPHLPDPARELLAGLVFRRA